jgi:hypothetical protein
VVNIIPLSVRVEAQGAVAGDGGTEGGQHDRAGDPVPGSDGQGVPGVVIEPGQHLDAGSVCEGGSG